METVGIPYRSGAPKSGCRDLRAPFAPKRLRTHGTRPIGGSWVVRIGVISRVTIVIAQIRGLITPLITTHEPPSSLLLNPKGPLLSALWAPLNLSGETVWVR